MPFSPQRPSEASFHSLLMDDFEDLTVEEAVELAWPGWQVRWTTTHQVEHGFEAGGIAEATGLVCSHRSEPWWATLSVWTGGSPVGRNTNWAQRDIEHRRSSIGRTIGFGFGPITSQTDQTLVDLILYAEVADPLVFDYGNGYAITLPARAILDAIPAGMLPDLDAARVLAALRA